MQEKPITALLVEDQEIVRLGLQAFLQQLGNVDIVASAPDGEAAINVAMEVKPDIVFMDIGLPILDGIRATKAIKEKLASKVIMITSHQEDVDIFASLSAGADAYCLKGISAPQMSNAINAVMSGAVWLDPDIAKSVCRAIAAGSQCRLAKNGGDGELTVREMQVLSLIVEGLTNQSIADRLGLSAETVKSHVKRIMDKLQVSDRTQAAVKAVKCGLLTAG